MSDVAERAPGMESRGRNDSVVAGARGDGGEFDEFADIEARSLEQSGNASPEREERFREDNLSSDHDSPRDDPPFGSRRASVSDLPGMPSERAGGTYAGEAKVENPGKTPRTVGPRAWLRLNEEGQCVSVQIDKHRLAQHLGVPMRDFRMLEPNRSDSYSAAILCRERCIVMHIEHVRLLITSESIFMQDGRSYTVTQILPELQRRLLMRKLKLMDGHAVPNAPLSAERIPGLEDAKTDDADGGGDADGAGAVAQRARFKQKLSNLGVDKAGRPAPAGVTASDLYDDAAAARKKKGVFAKGVASPPRPPEARGDEHEDVSQSGRRRSRDLVRSLEARESEAALPFELVGIEVALEMVCNQLERDRRDVGEEVRASLAGLRKKVDTFNLERVRRVKSKVTRLTGRVSKVREEIKRYLDDDSDMRDMYLTRKALVEDFHANEHERAAASATGGGGDFGAFRGRQSVNFHSGSFHAVHGSGGAFKMRRQSLNFGGVGGGGDGEKKDAGRPAGGADADASDSDDGAKGAPATPNPGVEDVFGEELFPHQEDSDLQVVEDLLETYFAHIDSTYAELDAIDQFINDTEDFVNIQLDVTRNQLQKFEVTLTSATLFVSMYSMVGGVYGMNLRNGAETSHATFVLVNALCGTGAVLGFALIMLYIRSKRWM